MPVVRKHKRTVKNKVTVVRRHLRKKPPSSVPNKPKKTLSPEHLKKLHRGKRKAAKQKKLVGKLDAVRAKRDHVAGKIDKGIVKSGKVSQLYGAVTAAKNQVQQFVN